MTSLNYGTMGNGKEWQPEQLVELASRAGQEGAYVAFGVPYGLFLRTK